MLDYDAISGWLSDRLPGEVSADYVSIREHSGRGYEAIGRVVVDGHDQAMVVRKILNAIQDAEESQDQGRPFKVQLRIFLAKEEDAAKVFADRSAEKPVSAADPQTELVQTVRELRLLVTDSTSAIAKLGRDSLQLAISQTERNSALSEENAQLKAALYLAENSQKDDLIQTMLPTIMQTVVAKMSGQ